MKKTLSICCIGHFLVDFACAFLLFSTFRGDAAWAELLILYNFCAFALQMPLGLWADDWKKDGGVAAAGAALVAAAYLFSAFPLAATALLGVGNAAFHVGGGLETISLSRGRAGVLGLFVSPGALGLYLGTVLGKIAALPPWIPAALALLSAAALFLYQTERVCVKSDLRGRKRAALLLLLFLVVVLRSCVGMLLEIPWKGEGHWALTVTFALVAGKAAGGILAQRFGAVRTAVISLLLSGICFYFAGIPFFGTLGVLLFNMTMPLTLWAAAKLLPGRGGLAFGLLTFALFIGFLPTAFGMAAFSGKRAAVLSLISLALLLPGLKKAVEI